MYVLTTLNNFVSKFNLKQNKYQRERLRRSSEEEKKNDDLSIESIDFDFRIMNVKRNSIATNM